MTTFETTSFDANKTETSNHYDLRWSCQISMKPVRIESSSRDQSFYGLRTACRFYKDMQTSNLHNYTWLRPSSMKSALAGSQRDRFKGFVLHKFDANETEASNHHDLRWSRQISMKPVRIESSSKDQSFYGLRAACGFYKDLQTSNLHNYTWLRPSSMKSALAGSQRDRFKGFVLHKFDANETEASNHYDLRWSRQISMKPVRIESSSRDQSFYGLRDACGFN